MTTKKLNSLSQQIEINAEWWLPDSGVSPILGTLYGSQDTEFNLRTNKNFGDVLTDPMANNILTIHGRVPGTNRCITLMGCVRLDPSPFMAAILVGSGSSGEQEGLYGVGLVLDGDHFNQEEELLFDNVTFGLSNFELWHGLMPFTSKYDHENQTVNIDYSKPEEVVLISNESYEVTVDYSMVPPGKEVGQVSATVEHSARLKIKALGDPIMLFDNQNEDTTTYLKIINRIESFIQFATEKSMVSYELRAQKKEYCEGWGEGGLPQKSVSIYKSVKVPSSISTISLGKMLFTWKYIEDDPSKYLQKWFELLDKIKITISSYLTSFREEFILEHRFMDLVQALEGYHQFKYPGDYKASKEHKRVLDRILDSRPEGVDGRWLRQQLGSSHKPSLRTKLLDILENHSLMIPNLYDLEGEKEILIKKIVANRNNYAHGNNTSKREFSTLFLLYVVHYLQAILCKSLLHEIGIPDEKIKTIISRNWRYRQLPDLLKKEMSKGEEK